MQQERLAVWSRRRLLGQAGGLAAIAFAPPVFGFGSGGWPVKSGTDTPGYERAQLQLASTPPLLDGLTAVCQRLAPAGWGDLLLAASDGELDITVDNLAEMVSQPLASVDRTIPGFEDFALEGTRGIEPGSPARSLLFHALASPNVFQDANGNVLSAFPTPAEIEVVENYVYGAVPPSLDDLRERAGDAPLGIVVFALEYRPGRETVLGRHADFCFSRTGHARLGTTEFVYDAQRREFLPAADDPFAFPVQPARYAPFIAAQHHAEPDAFGPLRALPDDDARLFWVPLHKLFSGPECLQGHDLSVSLAASHLNEKLRRFHQRMDNAGFYTGWAEPDINQFPFVIEGDTLAGFSTDPTHGSGWVMPTPHPLAEPAEYQGRPLTFYLSPELAANPTTTFFTSLQLLEAPPFDPLGPTRTQALEENIALVPEDVRRYLTTISPDIGRSSPEYLNARQKIQSDGTEVNLNDSPDVVDRLNTGGYWTRHYIDFAADGWVSARCAELDGEISTRVPAYSTICPPSFYPYTSQRELTEWAEHDAPEELRRGIWVIPPRPLSDRRMAANINLAAGFDIDDDTVTALVSLPVDSEPQQSGEPAEYVRRHFFLPDSAAGLFDPGWEISQDRTADNQFFLSDYGLGTPFIEDAKLCATLSTYWPGVSPDTAREFQPDKHLNDQFHAWPTVAPMTDEELGIVEVPGQGFLPWDGVHGPTLTTIDGKDVVDYPDVFHTDYVETVDAFTGALTGKVDQDEYVARVLAMAQIYWALGIRFTDNDGQYGLAEALDRFQAAKGEWNVLSFRALGEESDDELSQAEEATGIELQGDRRYRFHLFQWDGQETKPDDIRRILIGIKDQAIVYADLVDVLLQRNGNWEHIVPPQ